MNHNWTYKKLGEVGTVIGGSTPKTDNPEFWDGDYSWITPAELDGSKYVSSTVRTITEKAVAKTNLTLLPIGTVLLSSRAPIGKVCITKIPMYCNQGFKNIVCSDELNNEYLYWWLKGKNEYLNSLGVGATFKEISKRIVEQIPIPLPPLETQSRIVAELDLLQSIIDKQQAQLKELDTLAQSIFYDMFGDPVDNDKGWEVKMLGEVCSKITDGTHNSPINTSVGDFPYITAKNIKKDGIDLSDLTYVSKEVHKEIYSRCNPEVGDVLYIKDGITTGIAQVNVLDFEFSLLSSVALLKLNRSVINAYFVVGFLNNDSTYKKARSNMGGAAITRLTLVKIKNMDIIVPPLSLQQEFAEKIEKIERQKTAISQSIAETQKLFDYTMDKYFG